MSDILWLKCAELWVLRGVIHNSLIDDIECWV